MNNRGQFSIIAALLVAVILITTVIVTYSTIRSSPVQNQPPILSAIDETNLAIKQILGFAIGYYNSVLQITGNVSYAKTSATDYLHSGLLNIANMNPQWGTSLNLTSFALQAYWFTSTSYSSGNLTVNYDLAGLGIRGINYQTSCELSVQIINSSTSGQASLSITQDENNPLVTLGKQNLNFYRYNNASSTWELANPNAEPTAYSNGTYLVNVPSGVNSTSYVVQIKDKRGIIVVASSFNSYNSALTWNSTSVASTQTLYAHQETTTIGGSSYYLLKNSSADASGITFNASAASTGRQLMAKFVYQLTGTPSIPASNWTIYYRAYRNQGIRAHCDVDLLIRMVNGTIRWNTTSVAGSSDISSSYSTVSGTYSWTNSTVVQQTDFLEIDYYINVTQAGSGTFVYLRIDDATLALSNQTRTTNILLPGPTVDLYSLSRQGTIVVELLQDGTMRWLGQNLVLTNSNSTMPFPPVPVKSIHVNETINGVNGEVPFQIEDWSSGYRIPQGLTSNMSIFSGTTMLVFLATPNASKVTIWWNGSDMATQTPYAYTNRYFNDSPSSGRLSNGLTTLEVQNNFVVTSTVGTSSSTTNFMRINTDASSYGSLPAYVITNGTVRDIIHQEAEWGNGVTNCSDIYSDIVLTLPANATYYTYQLRLMLVQSQQDRTINDLCPVWLTSLTGQIQTENGTVSGLPIVSNATNLFYNYSASSWAHHWSQSVSAAKGAGIMFTDSANQNLYIFDSITGIKTGALNTNSTGIIQVSPIAKSQLSFNTTLDPRMQDIIWYGAVATFDMTTPIYNTPIYNNSDQTGLWMIVEYPPTVAVTAQNYQ